ncbi:hypothetical protein ZOSMA_160G00010 [Zostera marina]|uniref:ABC1 atypical kinase-like domain-containing protein n=1 Tax=Zostera marina TaxID=29655 RepID=A0A0K9PUH2_ZOSMR|nr:hypothetical protein ZOSMA_160G00010 [Zostera marina]
MVRLRGGEGIPFMKFFLAGTSVTTITLQFFRPDLLPTPIGAGFDSVICSSRALHTIGFVAVDYRYSLRGMDTSSDEYRSTLAEVNLRSAKRILKLCEVNRGFYVKAGQYFSSIRQIPKEYSSLLSSLQDQALPCNFKDVKRVLMKNLGKDMSQIFLMFDEEPIAAASIAQVHHAVLLDNH